MDPELYELQLGIKNFDLNELEMAFYSLFHVVIVSFFLVVFSNNEMNFAKNFIAVYEQEPLSGSGAAIFLRSHAP
jgi:hypothetical protein